MHRDSDFSFPPDSICETFIRINTDGSPLTSTESAESNTFLLMCCGIRSY